MGFHTWYSRGNASGTTILRHQTSRTVLLVLLGDCGWESAKEASGSAVMLPGKGQGS